MKQAPSIFAAAISRTWKRLPLAARLLLGVLVAITAILLNVAIDMRSRAPTEANAAIAGPTSADASVPDAGQALRVQELQEDPPVTTF